MLLVCYSLIRLIIMQNVSFPNSRQTEPKLKIDEPVQLYIVTPSWKDIAQE